MSINICNHRTHALTAHSIPMHYTLKQSAYCFGLVNLSIFHFASFSIISFCLSIVCLWSVWFSFQINKNTLARTDQAKEAEKKRLFFLIFLVISHIFFLFGYFIYLLLFAFYIYVSVCVRLFCNIKFLYFHWSSACSFIFIFIYFYLLLFKGDVSATNNKFLRCCCRCYSFNNFFPYFCVVVSFVVITGVSFAFVPKHSLDSVQSHKYSLHICYFFFHSFIWFLSFTLSAV